MALVIADRVQETTTTTGTGTITLAGAVSGFQSFAAIGNSNTTYYTIAHSTLAEWEVGIGTYTSSGTTLSRTTILSSSNSGSAVNFSAGTKNVFCTLPASRTMEKDASNIFTLDAGTTTVPPLAFQSGTNLTSASAGAMEYDGRVPYFTPIGAQRGVVKSEQVYRLNSAYNLANSSAVQSIFGVGVTLGANTQYQFEGQYYMSKTAGTTSHDHDFGFGGTAVVSNIFWEQILAAQNSSTVLPFRDTSPAIGVSNTAAVSLTMSVGITQASAVRIHLARGTVSVTTAGTFIPQIKFSNAPGGSWAINAGSYFKISPIGAANANVSVGTWA